MIFPSIYFLFLPSPLVFWSFVLCPGLQFDKWCYTGSGQAYGMFLSQFSKCYFFKLNDSVMHCNSFKICSNSLILLFYYC